MEPITYKPCQKEPRTYKRKPCQKCGNNQYRYCERQSKDSDIGAILFYVCIKCGETIKINS